MADTAAQHLTYHGGRYTWTGWTLRPLAGGGVGICVPCDLGAHWLTQAIPREHTMWAAR